MRHTYDIIFECPADSVEFDSSPCVSPIPGGSGAYILPHIPRVLWPPRFDLVSMDRRRGRVFRVDTWGECEESKGIPVTRSAAMNDNQDMARS